MRFWGMSVIGLLGSAILLSLGVWQVQRLSWKISVLKNIEAKVSAPARALPAVVSEKADSLLSVRVLGQYKGETLRVLVSQKLYGAGYRLITKLEIEDGRQILVDRGFVSVRAQMPATPEGIGELIGNLHWPSEIDSFTPENDVDANIWFSRDVATLAAELSTEPILLVLRDSSFVKEKATSLPVDVAGIPNDHLQYALTWFSLAIIWLGMSGYFLYRSRDSQS